MNYLKIPMENVSEVSDGYHTFNELYEHRVTLFIALCRLKCLHQREHNVWRSKKHADNSMHRGWFVMGINKDEEEQITYHLPLSKWDETNFAETMGNAPDFDGHTPADVLERLNNL